MTQSSRDQQPKQLSLEPQFWMLTILVVAVITWLAPPDRWNWFLDAGWVVAGLPLLWWTQSRFPLTPLLYRLLAFHALVLIAGGYWTYEKNPLGLWLQSLFQTERNHFDRFGHFMQGFVPAILARELFSRLSPVRSGGWLSYFAFLQCLAFSAFFELLEWLATVLSGEEGDAFLGHQGDIWDAQWDMLWAIIGCILSLTLFSRLHNRQMEKLQRSSDRIETSNAQMIR